MREHPTQATIAKALGFSQSAVSRVLKDPEGAQVAPEKIKKILEYIARSEKTLGAPYRGRNLVLVLPPYQRDRRERTYHRMLQEDLVRTLELLGTGKRRDLVVKFYNPNDPAALEGLSAWGAVVACTLPGGMLAAWSKRFPVVVLNDPKQDIGSYPPWDRVTTDNIAGMHHVVDHLVERGHRRIAFAGIRLDPRSPDAHWHFVERVDGFCQALRRHGLGVRKSWLFNHIARPGEAPQAMNQRIFKELLRGKDRPTALCFANDMLALRFLGYARDMGLQVPRKLAVTGFDDTGPAQRSNPPLTSVRQDYEGFARTALAIIEERGRSGVRTSRYQVRLAPKLVVRESTVPSP